MKFEGQVLSLPSKELPFHLCCCAVPNIPQHAWTGKYTRTLQRKALHSHKIPLIPHAFIRIQNVPTAKILLERALYVDYKPVPHIPVDKPLKSLVDVVYLYNLNLWVDFVCRAEVYHLLGVLRASSHTTR